MLVATLLCSLPLAGVMAGAGWKRWCGKRGTDSTSVVPQRQSVLPHVCALAAIVLSMMGLDYEGAAAVAVLAGMSEHMSRHASAKAARAIDAAIARVSQGTGGVRIIREMGADDKNQIQDLRNYLRDTTDNDDATRICSTGPGKGRLNTITSVYTVVSIVGAVCLCAVSVIPSIMPGMRQSGQVAWINDRAELLRQIAAVLLVSASPSAVLISKTAPFWCSVAANARQGLATKRLVETLLLGHDSLSSDDQGDVAGRSTVDYSAVHIGRACRRTTKQNLVISVAGRLAFLAVLGVIISHNVQKTVGTVGVIEAMIAVVCRSPWCALLLDLLVTFVVAFNSTGCGVHVWLT